MFKGFWTTFSLGAPDFLQWNNVRLLILVLLRLFLQLQLT